MKTQFRTPLSIALLKNNAPRLTVLGLLILLASCTPLDRRSKENPPSPSIPTKSSPNKNSNPSDSNESPSGDITLNPSSKDVDEATEKDPEQIQGKKEIPVEDSQPTATENPQPEPITIDDGKTVLIRGPLKMENAIVSFDAETEQISLKGNIIITDPNNNSKNTVNLPNAVLVGSVRETGVANLYPDSMTLKMLPDNTLIVAQSICFGNEKPYDKAIHNCQSIQINLFARQDKTEYTANLDSQKVTELLPEDKTNTEDKTKIVEKDQKEGSDLDSKAEPEKTPSTNKSGKSGDEKSKTSTDNESKDISKSQQEDFLMLIGKGIIAPEDLKKDQEDKSSSQEDPMEDEEEIDPSATITNTAISKDSIDFLESEFMFARKQGLTVAEAHQKKLIPPSSKNKTNPSQNKETDKCQGDPICIAKAKKRPFNQAFFFPQNGKMQSSTSLVALAKERSGNVPFMILRPQRGNYFGTYDLVKTVEALGAEVQKSLPGYKIMVRDMSKAKGGSFGHKSHTNGTDMDIAFIRKNGNKTPDFVTIADSKRIIDPSFDVATQWKAFYFLANDPRVHLNVIYLAPAIKQKMCDYTSSLRKKASPEELQRINKTLKALRSRSRASGNEISGHRNHFHVRLLCSKFDIGSRCRNYDTPDTKTGCR